MRYQRWTDFTCGMRIVAMSQIIFENIDNTDFS